MPDGSTADQRQVVVLNCGSSSVRCAILDPVTGERALSVHVEGVGGPTGRIRADDAGTVTDEVVESLDHDTAIRRALDLVAAGDLADVAGVGHRVTHGGDRFRSAVVLDDEVIAELTGLIGLAPLHLPANLAGIAAARRVLADRPQVAVFDTAFHQTMPPVAYRYAVPEAWYADHGVRRYGFHGTSHSFVAHRAAQLLGRPLTELRMVTLHLGNGCSATAIRDGVSVDTTMGLTPLEGLVMGTRSGDVDPGLVGYLGSVAGMPSDRVLDALLNESGLLGVSGISPDMRLVEDAAANGDPRAALALDLMAYRIAKAVAALAVPLERLDAVVFTGGIGEGSVVLRTAVLDRLGVLGLAVDPVANDAGGRDTDGRVSTPGATLALVVRTDEERSIGADVVALLGQTYVDVVR